MYFVCLLSVGNIVPPDHVLDGVRKILAKDEKPADFPVGVLTTEKRDVWGIMRQHLESLGNTEVLNDRWTSY